MCKCYKQPNFKQRLREAAKATETTGKQHVVFYMEAVKQLFIGPLEEINDDFGICCYYLPDGTEVQYASGSNPAPVAAEKPAAEMKVEVSAFDESGDISDAAYENFVDNDMVSKIIIDHLAKKVQSSEKMTEKETAIFNGKTSEVEKAVKKLK